jgi:hypothetical protein
MSTRSRNAEGGTSPTIDSPPSQPGDQSVNRTRTTPVCPECGSPNRPQSQFCADCGAPLRRYCPHCGEPIPMGLDSCPRCSEARGGPSALAARCQRCGFENDSQAELCQQCGARLLANCPQCGSLNQASLTYCPHCGFNYSRYVADRLVGTPAKPEPEVQQAGRLHPGTILMAALIVISVLLMLYVLSQIRV